jgi:hypothetical protein
MVATVPGRLSARYATYDVSDGDGATQRQEGTRSHGRERSIGELDSLLPHLHRNLSDPIRRPDGGIRRVRRTATNGIGKSSGKRRVPDDDRI